MASMMVAAMEYLPIGFRFHPTDEELLGHYLRRKNLGLVEPDCVIPEVDLFRWEPEELQAKFTESPIVQSKDLKCWFFYEHKPGQMQERSTRGGYWRITGQTSDIKSRNGTRQIIRSKKILTFYQGNSSNSTKTNWVMHEYRLASSALDGLFGGNRKNYVVCMIKCNADCELDEPMTVDITNILEAEADDCFILEESLEPLCMSHGINPNLHQELAQFLDRSNNSGASRGTEFSLGGDLVVFDLPSSAGEYSPSLTIISNQVLVGTDEHPSVCEMLTSPTGTGDMFTMPNNYALLPASDNLDENIFEALWPKQELAVTVENKQTPEVESLHGFVPLDKEKDIVEDDSNKSFASSLQMETPKMRSKKELTQIISYVPSEAKALFDDPSKIKEEIVSATSPSTSTGNPRKRATAILLGGGHTSDSNTIEKKEINSMSAVNEPEKPARRWKLTTAKPRSCSFRQNNRRCSCKDPSVADYWYLLVAIILCLAVYILCRNFFYGGQGFNQYGRGWEHHGYGPSQRGRFKFRIPAFHQ